jgi:hypothetical protein
MFNETRHGYRGEVVAVVLVALAGCTASPTTPTAAPPLATGTYTLSLVTPDSILVNNQLVPACPGAGTFGAVVTDATVAADGDQSRVRPRTAAGGTFEIVLVRDPNGSQSGIVTSGSIRGVAINTMYAVSSDGAPADVRATFSGIAPASAAQLQGVVRGNSALVDGTVVGTVVVGDSSGSTVSCAPGTVRWSLSRVP